MSAAMWPRAAAARTSSAVVASSTSPLLSASRRTAPIRSRARRKAVPRAERKPVVSTGHAQRLAQLGGTRAQLAVSDPPASPPPPHRRQSFEGLEGADEHGSGEPRALGHGVQTPVHPIGEVDVGRARTLEQAGVAARAACAIAVRGGVMGAEVGLGLDDTAGGPAAAELAQENMAQKPTRDLRSRSRVERRRQRRASHVPPVSPRFTFDQKDSPASPVSTSGSRAGGLGAGGCGGSGSALAVRDSGASRDSMRSLATRSTRSPPPRPSPPAPRPRPPRPRPPPP